MGETPPPFRSFSEEKKTRDASAYKKTNISYVDYKDFCRRFVKPYFLSLNFSDTFIQVKITGSKNTIFRAFASLDKNGPTFVTITSAAFDPEKTTFSSDNK